MAIVSYANIGAANDVLKNFYLDPVREQLNNSTLLMKRLTRNTEDIQGGRAFIAMHNARNYGTGARPAGYQLPVMGKQGHVQSYTDLKYNYGRFFVTGPDIVKTKGNKGSFVKIVDNEVKGLLRDLKRDINRQLFADGSGILAFVNTAYTTDGASSGTLTVSPFLWSPATKYLDTTSMEFGVLDLSSEYGATLPAETDGADSSPKVAASTSTYVEGANCTLGWTAATSTMMNGDLAAGDAITKWRSGFLKSATAGAGTVSSREMMGLDGIIHDTNLLGDTDWKMGRVGGTGSFVTPEQSSSYDVSISSNDTINILQNVDCETSPFWRSKVYDNAGVPRALTLAMMNEAMGYQRTIVGVTPSLIVTTYKVRNKYAELMSQDRRYVNTMSLDGGFSAVEFNGSPLTDDPDCPRGRMYFVSEENLQLYVGQDFDWITDGGGGVLHYISGWDAYEAVLRYFAELGTDRRNAHCKIIDILEV